MTYDEMMDVFDRHHDEEFLEFDRIAVKKAKQGDLHAFITLSELYPDHKGDIVDSAEHDTIYLFPGLGDDMPFTEAIVIDLIRCGVCHDEETDSLRMYV